MRRKQLAFSSTCMNLSLCTKDFSANTGDTFDWSEKVGVILLCCVAPLSVKNFCASFVHMSFFGLVVHWNKHTRHLHFVSEHRNNKYFSPVKFVGRFRLFCMDNCVPREIDLNLSASGNW